MVIVFWRSLQAQGIDMLRLALGFWLMEVLCSNFSDLSLLLFDILDFNLINFQSNLIFDISPSNLILINKSLTEILRGHFTPMTLKFHSSVV